jgi:2-amino-4-hydroxy-6-hydroxymethyldihydropteridine diphosphokinase
MEYGLSLGSNVGDRLANLVAARRRIAGLPGTRIAGASAVYETEPVDVAAQFRNMAFLNTTLVVESDLKPEQLGAELREIEDALGRVRSADRNAPRSVDVDIIYADALEMETETLTLPHPRWASRRFVVQPLADIRPDLTLTAGTPTVREVLLSLPDKPEVVLFSAEWQ